MEGRIESINGARARAGALAAYLKRYPFVRDFFSGAAAVSHQVASKVSRVELYAFRPFDIWYVDNEVGFGTGGSSKFKTENLLAIQFWTDHGAFGAC